MAVAGLPGQLVAEADGENVPRPNILVFLSDDMGWGQPGFNGGTEVATPHMDRIADEGVKLTQFYVQPVCTPTRGSLLSGRYDWKNGTENRVGSSFDNHGMLTDERTIAEALGDAGYATWVVGQVAPGAMATRSTFPCSADSSITMGTIRGKSIRSRFIAAGIAAGFWTGTGMDVPWSRPATRPFSWPTRPTRLIERHDGSQPLFPVSAVQRGTQPQ